MSSHRNDARSAPKGSFDALLASYQKWSLVSFYPAIMSLVAVFFALSGNSFVYMFSLGGFSSLSVYFSAYPFGNNNLYGSIITVGSCFLFVIISFFLSQGAAKAKFPCLVAAFAIYLADTIYSCFLIIPGYPGGLSPLYYGLTIGVHAIFLILYALVFLSYGKLWRFQNEINKKQHAKPDNITK